MTPEEQRILAAHKQQTQALRRSVKDTVEALWDSLPSHNRNMIPEFLEQVIPLVEAQQQQMAAVTEMYLRQSAIAQGTEIGATSPVNVSTRALRHVPASEVYERPFTEVYRLLKEGKELQEALDAGKRRLVSLAHTGLQLAKTHTSQNLLGGSGFVGYRRVLVGPYNCGLCIVASTQRYHVGDLQPIHPGCVVEGTLVSAVGGPKASAATRRMYSGQIIRVEANGRVLELTPNHPVLTPLGWVPAGNLKHNDVIHLADSSRANTVPIEDLFNKAGSSQTIETPSDSFHGDGGGVTELRWLTPYVPSVKYSAPPNAMPGSSAYRKPGIDLLNVRKFIPSRVDHLSANYRDVPVYNLETSEGWYSAGGIAVSNCDCTVAAFTADKDPGWVINRAQLENVHKAMADTFGSFDRSARGFTQIRGQVVQYRDVTLTRMNSELGPVLTVASHHHRAL